MSTLIKTTQNVVLKVGEMMIGIVIGLAVSITLLHLGRYLSLHPWFITWIIAHAILIALSIYGVYRLIKSGYKQAFYTLLLIGFAIGLIFSLSQIRIYPTHFPQNPKTSP